uniref:Nuclear receptor subfamily 1 group D member 1 n=1 Tax=Nomascus leucogenys TaxID=61853 RepID=G1QLK6_NOMLE
MVCARPPPPTLPPGLLALHTTAATSPTATGTVYAPPTCMQPQKARHLPTIPGRATQRMFCWHVL